MGKLVRCQSSDHWELTKAATQFNAIIWTISFVIELKEGVSQLHFDFNSEAFDLSVNQNLKMDRANKWKNGAKYC